METLKKIRTVEVEIENIKGKFSNEVKSYDEIISYCRNILNELKQKVLLESFRSMNDEITFFKVIKQEAFHNLVLYSDLKSFEIQFPRGNKVVQEKFIQKKVAKLNRFFLCNMDFVQYIEQEKTHLDKFYFTREYFSDFNIIHSKDYFQDVEFCTSHDVLLAKLKAKKKLLAFLEYRLNNLDKETLPPFGAPVSNLRWSGSKADLTELIYGLYSQKIINNGNAELKEIAMAMAQAFNFQIGDIYKTFSEIRIRKKSRTKFLNDLSQSLSNKMNRLDSL